MLSTKAAKRHTAGWMTHLGAEAPVFLIRPGSVIERAQLEAELTGEYGAARVFAFDLSKAFREGVEALCDSDDAARLVGIADAEAALPEGEALPKEEASILREARAELAKHWPAYRALRTRMALRTEVAPIIALRRFCVGGERVMGMDGKPITFERGPDGFLMLDEIGRIDPFQMLDAGNAAYQLLYPEEDLRGNSQQPSQSDESQPLSTSDASSTKDGGSPARSGKKTRSASSRRKSGAS